MRLRLFTEAQAEAFGARTLDGSPSGYYFREGDEADSFVIYLQGGGLCVEPIDCRSRSKGPYGTSKAWHENHTDDSNVLSTDASFNPFANWSHVWIPYGSGDVYVGTQRRRNLMDLYFAGHNTLEAVVSDLKNTTRLGAAQRVLLSGASAGGIGSLQNADWLGQQLSNATRFRASPQAG